MLHVKTDPFTQLSKLKVFSTLCMVSTQATDLSPRLIDLLMRWGAGVDWLQARATFPLEDGQTEIHKYSPLACAILYSSSYGTRHIAVAHALLRGGASLDAVATITVKDAQGNQGTSRSESIEWVLGEKERREPSLADKAHYLALKAFLLSVRAAGGYRSFVIEQRRTCSLVRHLALRDRATTRLRLNTSPARANGLVPTGALVPIAAAAAAAHNDLRMGGNWRSTFFQLKSQQRS